MKKTVVLVLCAGSLWGCKPLYTGAADGCLLGLNDAGERIAQCDANLMDADDVEALAGVVEVSGFLAVRGPTVDDLSALSQLRQIGGTLSVAAVKQAARAPRLTSLAGLGSLAWVGDDLQLIDTNLENLDALRALTHVGGHLAIRDNADLVDVDGLASLTRIVGDVSVSENPSLTSLRGLAAVTQLGPDDMAPCDGGVGGGVDISENEVLDTLEGLEHIPLARAVSVSGAAIVSVDGLRGLTQVESLEIVGTAVPKAEIDALSAGVDLCED